MTGVVAVFRNGGGPTVMLRADMDGLPMRADTGLPYASTVTAKDEHGMVGVAHSCGHDMHVAWILGAARILTENRSAWQGTKENIIPDDAYLTACTGGIFRDLAIGAMAPVGLADWRHLACAIAAPASRSGAVLGSTG